MVGVELGDGQLFKRSGRGRDQLAVPPMEEFTEIKVREIRKVVDEGDESIDCGDTTLQGEV